MVVKLIAKDKKENFQFEGRCKLTINSISKLLLVEPFNEEFKIISANFKWKFVAQKNILFVFAENDFQDFALIFDDTKKCKKVYNILLQKGATLGDKTLIQEQFLSFLFEIIAKNFETTLKMKQILITWIECHNEKEKEGYIKILKDKNIYGLIYSSEVLKTNHRKCKANDIVYQNENSKPPNVVDGAAFKKKQYSPKFLPEIVEAPNFEVLKYAVNGVSKRKLSIFPTSDKKYCYEYFWWKTQQCFICNPCSRKKNYLSAKIVNTNGKDVVLLKGGQHKCEIREKKTIYEKPNFEIFSYERRGTIVSGFVLFLDSTKSTCYEYFWNNKCKVYCCRGCSNNKKYVAADICLKDDGTKFIMLRSNQHICEKRKFNPEKYAKKEIIKTASFKIFKQFQNEIDRSKLVIFTTSDKASCYEYFWNNARKCFCCYGCYKRRKSVTAHVCQNLDGSKYLKINREKHLCEPCDYDPKKYESSKKEIIDSSNFKIFEYKHNGLLASKLILFCETNKNLCYEYYWNKFSQMYFCTYCPISNQVTATVFNNNNSIMLNKNQHICDLHEFDPEKYKDDIIIDKSMYKITSSVMQRSKSNILVIFTSKEKKYYYKYLYSHPRKYYYCTKCITYSHTFKLYITATIKDEGKENECLYVSNQKHICEPLEYAELKTDNIVMAPNFQLLKRKFNGKIVQHMVIFTNDEKSECFEYRWNEKQNFFICSPCRKYKCFVYARIFKNNKNDECVELGQNSHKCKPIKFLPENLIGNIIKLPNFKLYEVMFRQKPCKRLAIFDSNNRNMGYIYNFRPQGGCFQCIPCSNKKKFVTAKIFQDEDGENYVQLNETKHFCELRKL